MSVVFATLTNYVLLSIELVQQLAINVLDHLVDLFDLVQLHQLAPVLLLTLLNLLLQVVKQDLFIFVQLNLLPLESFS